MNKIGSIVAGVIVLGLASAALWLLTRPMPASRSVSGTIETDEAHVASRYGGRVERLFAEEGDTLRAGQAIVQLEAAELQAQRDYAAAVLAELEHGARPEELAAAKSDWESLVAQLAFARLDARRTQELFAQKTSSATDRDRAVSQADALEKNVAATKSRYDLLLAGTRPERIDQARAQLAQVETQLREMRIAAPTNCVLEVLNVRVGDVLAPNREVATLLLPQHYWARVYVPETWLGHLQLGQRVTVRVDSFPDKDFSGTIEQINGAAEFTPRNVQTVEERIKQVFGIKVRLANESGRLRPGMSADVFFPNVPAPAK
ncbi:MAG: HlyD family secretion protein [Limisphaerales bacterium]